MVDVPVLPNRGAQDNGIRASGNLFVVIQNAGTSVVGSRGTRGYMEKCGREHGWQRD